MVVDLHRSLEKVIEAAETKSAASLAAVDLHRLLDGGVVRRPVRSVRKKMNMVKTKKKSTHVTLLPMAMILHRSVDSMAKESAALQPCQAVPVI